MVELYDWMTSDAEHEPVRQRVVFGDPDAMMGNAPATKLTLQNYAEGLALVLRDICVRGRPVISPMCNVTSSGTRRLPTFTAPSQVQR